MVHSLAALNREKLSDQRGARVRLDANLCYAILAWVQERGLGSAVPAAAVRSTRSDLTQSNPIQSNAG